MPMWRAGPINSGGFTLLEALVVLMILSLAGMTLGLSIPGTRERVQVAAVGARLEVTLLEARAQARREGTIRSVVFDLQTRRYRIDETGDWQVLPSNLEMSVISARELGESDRAAVAFLPDGTSSGADITLTMGEQQISRRVEWLTGRIRREPR